MPFDVACDACGARLKVADKLANSSVRCPRCNATFPVAAANVLVEPIADNRESSNRRGDDGPETVNEGARPPRKKRRRLRQPAAARETARGSWAGAIAGAIAFCGLFLASALLLTFGGLTSVAVAYLMVFLILLPVSTVILVVSMFLASFVAGGIDFGDARITIPKAMALLFVVNLIGLIPWCGFFLATAVWWIALMSLFKLEFWETFILVVINSGLNFALCMLILSTLLAGSSANHGEAKPPFQSVALAVSSRMCEQQIARIIPWNMEPVR